MVREKNVLEKFMSLERVQNIDDKTAERHGAVFLHAYEDYNGESKVVVPRFLGFNQTCKFFFDKGIEDFTLWQDDKYWVMEFGTCDICVTE